MPLPRSRRRRRTRAGRVCLALGAIASLAWPRGGALASEPLDPLASEPLDPVAVRFDGACPSQVIELEVWNRSEGRWDPHPEHPFVLAGSCHVEDAGYLLNEVRTRCVAIGDAPEEPWSAGVRVFQRGVVDACTPPQDRRPQVEITAPGPDEVVRNETQTVRLEGRVHFGEVEIGESASALAIRLADEERRALPRASGIEVENATVGAPALEVSLRPDGQFSAVVPLEAGENRIRAWATASNGRSGSTEAEMEFDISLLREKWLAAERRRMERVRERLRGRVEIEAEGER